MATEVVFLMGNKLSDYFNKKFTKGNKIWKGKMASRVGIEGRAMTKEPRVHPGNVQ